MDLDDAVHEVYRRRVDALGLSGRALATKLGRPQASVRRELSGLSDPDLQGWEDLARAVDWDLETLVEHGRQLLRHLDDPRDDAQG